MRYLSLFSGIEAASVAWKPLGWQCVGVAEIDPFPCAVLKHHYPEVPNLGSVTDITDDQIAALGPIDVVVGGSPCQDLSVAGKRAGLAGARSGLFHHQLRIFHAARHLCGARYLLWENVPGAFSSNGGRDFAVVVGAMAGCSVPVPEDGWGTEGVVLGEHGLVEWALLDAQWFGVAQRRRRVFAVLDVGDWASRPPILLERESLRGDSAPSREAGKDVAGSTGDGIARCLTTGEGFDASEDGTGRGTPLVPVVAPTLRAGGNKTGGDRPPGTDVDTCESLIPVACDVWNQSIDGDVAATLNAASGTSNHSGLKVMVPVAIPIISDADRSNSEALTPSADAEGRVRLRNPGLGVGDEGDPMFTLQATKPHAVAYIADDYRDGTFEQTDTARPLTTSADRTRAAPVVTTLAIRGRGDSHDLEMRTDGTANALLTPNGGRAGIGVGAIHCGMQVRRLTPVECSRLQGFSDSYLDITYRGKPAADGNKYKALGNSMAVPVMRWIGRQIEAAA